MGYSMEASRDNCYPNTTCLINKFGIKDDKKLSEIETEITFAKAAILESEEAELPLDFGFYKYIHCFLFEDLYDWAGKLRKVDISKKRTAFCPVKELESSCKACFNRLKEENYFKEYSREQFVEEIVDFYVTTNFLHPFREGNGRTQRIFISKLIKYNGYDFNFSNIDPDFLMIATIKASSGVTDNLYDIFNNGIR
ncbi:MAG: cell filamentation protein Fic [Ruminococcaceae bacterium]|nr:cell filamentation protein Fic [Oscillospiraceae bacterium]